MMAHQYPVILVLLSLKSLQRIIILFVLLCFSVCLIIMPKRQCPFAESNRPQLKTHIGLQELSMGVMGLETMNHVYGKDIDYSHEPKL